MNSKVLVKADSLKERKGFTAKNLYNQPNAQLVHFDLSPGNTIEPHRMDMEVLFYIMEGEGMLLLNGEKYLFKQDTMINVEKGAVRGWYNHSDKPLRILVYKINTDFCVKDN